MVQIAVTGVTGKLGGLVVEFLQDKGVSARYLARTPQKASHLPADQVYQTSYEYSPQSVAALSGVDVLFMVSASESLERVSQHKGFLDAAKEAGVKHIIYTSFYNASPQSIFTLARDHAATESYIKELGFTYTFLRDNFYMDFFLELCESGEIRGPAGDGKVSAVFRQDVAEVAASILQAPEKWENQILNMCGPKEWSMAELVAVVGKAKGQAIAYVDETIEEAYVSRKAWPADQWEYDSWVSTYTAIKEGEQAGLSDAIERVLGRKPTSLEQELEK